MSLSSSNWNNVIVIILQILLSVQIISCQNIGIHELSHDYNLKKINVQNVQNIISSLDQSINYQYRYQPIPNTTVRYFLAKPWRLRLREFHDQTNYVRILYRQTQIRFDHIRQTHEGLYSLYQFFFQQSSNPNDDDNHNDNDNDYQQQLSNYYGHLVHYQRRDFNLVVQGK